VLSARVCSKVVREPDWASRPVFKVVIVALVASALVANSFVALMTVARIGLSLIVRNPRESSPTASGIEMDVSD
jgi:hypothetical protein